MSNEASLRLRKGKEDSDPVQMVQRPAIPVGKTGKWDHLYMHGGATWDRFEVEDIVRLSVMMQSKGAQSLAKSTTNATQEVKDELSNDPYNIKLIYALGLRYFGEFQWDLCSNVLLRGWKRVSELADVNERFIFLMKLSEASYRNFQFKQAQAVLMDVDEPEGIEARRAYYLLGCQVHAQVGDLSKSLSAFSKAIEKEDFEIAVKIWAACVLALKRVGAFEPSKTQIAKKVRKDHAYNDESQLRTVETWSVLPMMPEENKNTWDLIKQGKPPSWVYCFSIANVLVFVVGLLYLIEQYSLTRLNLNTL